MDDWKLSAVTVVRLEKDLNTLVTLVMLLYVQEAFTCFEPNLITRKHINEVTFETQLNEPPTKVSGLQGEKS